MRPNSDFCRATLALLHFDEGKQRSPKATGRRQESTSSRLHSRQRRRRRRRMRMRRRRRSGRRRRPGGTGKRKSNFSDRWRSKRFQTQSCGVATRLFLTSGSRCWVLCSTIISCALQGSGDFFFLCGTFCYFPSGLSAASWDCFSEPMYYFFFLPRHNHMFLTGPCVIFLLLHRSDIGVTRQPNISKNLTTPKIAVRKRHKHK